MTEACRALLAHRTAALTGQAVTTIDIEVTELRAETAAGKSIR
ncbi:hypothetical protein [Nocardia sp. NPDC057668]